MQIVSVYTALLTLVFVVLSARIIVMRRGHKVSLGDGGHPAMQRAIRAHGNFAEYVPLSLLVFYALAPKASALVLHGLCLCLLAGRLSHAYGVSATGGRMRWRVGGMVLTLIALSAGALLLALQNLPGLLGQD